MATLAGLRQDTYNILFGQARIRRPVEDTLSGAFGAGVTTMPVNNDTIWKEGDYAEFDGDGELVIAASDGTGGNVTVRRGQRGTTDAAQSSGDVIRKNPTFAQTDIDKQINLVVDNDLWPYVWFASHRSFTWTTGDHLYDLNANDMDVIDMYQFNLDGDNKLWPLPGSWWDFRTVHADAATNNRLLRVQKVHDQDATVYYTAKTRPTSGDLASLSTQIENMVPYGAVYRLLAGEVPEARVSPDRDPRAVDAAQRMARDPRLFQTLFEDMRAEEKSRLMLEYKPRKRHRHRRWAEKAW